jgi:hypothetical protein
VESAADSHPEGGEMEGIELERGAMRGYTARDEKAA